LEKPDKWEARLGLASALKECAPYISSKALDDLFAFMIDQPGSFGDRNENVRRKMSEASLAVVDEHGKALSAHIVNICNKFLESNVSADEKHDLIHESVVVLMGAAAKHLDPSEPNLKIIIYRLIDTLKTPSEPVQVAVAGCLPPLVKLVKDMVPSLAEQCLTMALASDSYGIRRGGAYGLAGIVKGCGITVMKELKILEKLKQSVEDKKNENARQGAVFAFETLASMLGRLFEPYVLSILPNLLTAFGDSAVGVREATHDAARVIMSNLSAHCVSPFPIFFF
jgi:hypothetical protein